MVITDSGAESEPGLRTMRHSWTMQMLPNSRRLTEALRQPSCKLVAYLGGSKQHSGAAYKVEAAQAAHEALDVVGHPEKPLLPARLPLDLGLNARLHAVQHTWHCCKDAGLQRCHIIRHLLHIPLQH